MILLYKDYNFSNFLMQPVFEEMLWSIGNLTVTNIISLAPRKCLSGAGERV